MESVYLIYWAIFLIVFSAAISAAAVNEPPKNESTMSYSETQWFRLSVFALVFGIGTTMFFVLATVQLWFMQQGTWILPSISGMTTPKCGFATFEDMRAAFIAWLIAAISMLPMLLTLGIKSFWYFPPEGSETTIRTRSVEWRKVYKPFGLYPESRPAKQASESFSELFSFIGWLASVGVILIFTISIGLDNDSTTANVGFPFLLSFGITWLLFLPVRAKLQAHASVNEK